MAIVKVASCVPAAKSGYSCGDEDLTREETILLQSFPSLVSDDCEHAEVDCELARCEGQICNVPYGLYDLPKLKDVLSLDAWNLCLTEEDRFRLAAYLPDMDQHDFFSTMDELLSGSAMFFGSPLTSFFQRLNGGFYSPEVSQPRELLMVFQRRRYYHFLKSYHDGMVWKFTSMDKLQISCHKSTSLQEKVHIWHDIRYEKPLKVVDQNSSPFNRSLSVIDEGEDSTPIKRAKLIDGTSTSHCSAEHKGIDQRAKSMEISSLKSHIFHLPKEPSKQCIKLPKGVLKIKTDCASTADHNEGIDHASGLMPSNQLGIQVSNLPPEAPGVYSFAMDSTYYYHINSSRSAPGNPCSNPLKRVGALNTYPLLAKSPLGVQNTALEELKRGNCSALLGNFYQSAIKHNLAYSDEAYGSGTKEFPHEKNLLKNFGRDNAVIPESSPDPFTRSRNDYQMNGFTQIHNSKSAENVSEILTLGTSIRPPYKHLMQQSQIMGRYQEGLKFKTPGSNSVAEIEEEYRYPYTYNRRKLDKRHGLVDPAKKSTMGVLESPSALASMENVKAKAIKL